MNQTEIKANDKIPAFDQTASTSTGSYFKPAADIYEDSEKVLLTLDIPGVQNDDLDIKVQNNLLRLTGVVNKKKTAKTLIEEYRIGDYYREFALSDMIDLENIKASLLNGVLQLTLPKLETVKPKKIWHLSSKLLIGRKI